MLFNVYYLNFSKVYEIKMMLSNVIKTDESIETGQNDTIDAAMQAKMGKENFKSKISPELRSRFDYKGVFNLLTDEDKKKFVHFRVNQIIAKYREFVSADIPDRLHDVIVSEINVSQFKNMRDLNKKIKDTFVAHIKS